MSLLSWERGLKYLSMNADDDGFVVAPLVGAWIEIDDDFKLLLAKSSLLSWERGLKY